jgi:hypothetical protein
LKQIREVTRSSVHAETSQDLSSDAPPETSRTTDSRAPTETTQGTPNSFDDLRAALVHLLDAIDAGDVHPEVASDLLRALRRQ